MFDDLNDLYQQVILDHCKQPRNFHELPQSFFPRIAILGIIGTCLFVMPSLPVQAEKALNVSTKQAAAKSNPANSISANSALENKMVEARMTVLWKLVDDEGRTRDAARWEKFEDGARQIINDFPDRAEGYYLIMYLMGRKAYEDPQKTHGLANEILNGSAPERFKLWANGFLNRTDGIGKPVIIRFTAVDGREVDLAKMKGKVVLIEFWATDCPPCVMEFPKVEATYRKFHPQGFEVIGISCDDNKAKLEKFIKRKRVPWPQFFDGKSQTDNRIAQAFGINGIPHMMLVDKQGCLRFDREWDEDKITKLLTE